MKASWVSGWTFGLLSAIGAAAGCAAQRPATAPGPEAKSEPRVEVLRAGTPVRCVLLRRLISGVAREGEIFPLLVLEDVRAEGGGVAIRRGTVVLGEVTWSRGSDPLRTLANQPARLAIRVLRTRAVDGQTVPLSASPRADRPDEALVVTRAMTRRPAEEARGEGVLADAQNRAVLEDVVALFDRGATRWKAGPERERELGRIARELGLRQVEEVSRAGDLARLIDWIGKIEGLTGTSEVFGVDLGYVGAIVELANLAQRASARFGGMLRGPNVIAEPGTPIEARVAEPVAVAVEGR